jgi:hypothetical protein
MKTAHRQFKDAFYEQVARLGKAISVPKRLELLSLLCVNPELLAPARCAKTKRRH